MSKDYLAGEKKFERILIRPAAFWVERQIELRLGERVVSVDPAGRSVGTATGYGTLVWATGGAARSLTCSGHDLAGVHAVRNRADVDRLEAELAATRRVSIVAGTSISHPIACSASASAMRPASKPSTTTTYPPDISVASACSVPPMWNIGTHAT